MDVFYKILGVFIGALGIGLFFWNKLRPIKEELNSEKNRAQEIARMTPEEIKKKEGVDLSSKVRILPILGFMLSVVCFFLFSIAGLFISMKMGLEGTVKEKVIIVLGIAIGFSIFLFGIIKFHKTMHLMQVKELRKMGEAMKRENYYWLTFKRSLAVIIIIAILTLLFVFIANNFT